MDKKLKDFQNWIDTYSSALLNRAFYLLSNREDAEDIVQDVFVAAFDSYDSFKGESSPKTWLMNILKFKIADFYRKKYKYSGDIKLNHFFNNEGFWKEDNVIGEWQNTEENLLDNTVFNDVFSDCLEQLPSKWLITFKLYYLEEKKSDIICQDMGISTTNLWKMLQRSRLHLRECLEFNWFKM